jgi:putative flippase GtrA
MTAVLPWLFSSHVRGLKGSWLKNKVAVVLNKQLLNGETQQLAGQVIRFGVSGGFLTLLVAGGYWAVARFGGIDPNVSLTLVFIVASGIGYLLHSRWSFKGHGSRDNVAARGAKFAVTNILGFLSNQFFVWLLVKYLGGPTWWPVIPIVLVTPLLTFTLNRRWVFG